ncbi:MAG: Ig-like domain-containing protein [Marinifilaceae bacterium]
MNIHIKKYFIILIAFCSLSSCQKEDVIIHVKELKFTNIEGNIYTGNKIKIETIIFPKNATNKTIIWTSENEEIAIVEDGVISGIKAGTTNITALSEDSGIIESYKIIVSISVESVNITNTITKLEVGKTLQMKATILPIESTNKGIKWETNSKKIATISEDGLVTAIGNGVLTITAKSLGGGKAAEYRICIVTPVKDILLTPNKGKIKVGEPIQLTPRIFPRKASNRTVRWVSSNNNIVSVNAFGVITGKSIGKATITVITECGNKKGTCEVEVTNFIYIPDKNFRFALLAAKIDNNKDGEFTQEEISEVHDLKINNQDIADLTGIRAFKNLYTLLCKGNQINSLDLSGCKGLTTIDCSENKITNLNITNCTEIVKLTCKQNKITSLNLSNCPDINRIYCEYNSLTSINLNNCTKLTYIDCTGNELSSLNLSNCKELDTIDCDENNLSEKLDFSTCTKITDISCKNNYITALEITKCIMLKSLICSSNRLSELLLPKTLALETLNYDNNPVITVDTSDCPNVKYSKAPIK